MAWILLHYYCCLHGTSPRKRAFAVTDHMYEGQSKALCFSWNDVIVINTAGKAYKKAPRHQLPAGTQNSQGVLAALNAASGNLMVGRFIYRT